MPMVTLHVPRWLDSLLFASIKVLFDSIFYPLSSEFTIVEYSRFLNIWFLLLMKFKLVTTRVSSVFSR
jgi:hypothetical protein